MGFLPLSSIRKKSCTLRELAIQTLEELQAIEEGEAEADRLFFLREQAKQKRLEELKLASLGKPETAPTTGS
ncbi:MAG: hypothetical protein NW220_07390 [Leptolyngbyaceae cyanobacterium bins.349]|nr:hypothetical protein [Leptolyngbyaceae cyanobacterium bins.349]